MSDRYSSLRRNNNQNFFHAKTHEWKFQTQREQAKSKVQILIQGWNKFLKQTLRRLGK